MEKYIVIYASYLESEGLDASVQVYDALKDAKKALEDTFNFLADNYDGGSIEWANLEENSYSMGGLNRFSLHERYEGYIDKITI